MRRGGPILAAFLLLAPSAAGAGESGPSVNAERVLERLHDGRFAAARAALSGGDRRPEALFLAAFTTYWNLIFDDENETLRRTMETQIRAVLAAVDRGGDGESDASDAVWGGTAHLLLAELRASERHPFGAAFEAKRAKKMLEKAAGRGADTSDALFGLGTYNYMADTVPAFIKGLRALLFLPGGDRERGLAQLEEAAAESPHFSFEARALLVTIYANRHEERYDLALDELAKLLHAHPEALASLYAAARLDISLGRNEAALAFLDRADARARTFGDVDPVVARSVDLLRAKAEFARLRPDLALATAERALASGSGLTDDIRRDLEAIRSAAAYNAGGIDWSRVGSSLAGPEAPAGLAGLAKAAPDRPLLALLTGDAFLRQGRAADALTWFGRAEASGLPPGLVGPKLLRQGQAADLLGERPRALAYYREAADLPGFAAKDAALYFQAKPYRDPQ